ncbi:transmembrane amino acid transporter protein-domain-containing protein [Lentinula aciculospora]|uniref:Transmembrane amino acid transporter protein-domain-containing protein n=1 Tax=Lentinula aciculospora TaxID=153920 RepID=A0A9W9AMG3_9AGAR|nr:transmembrane amino acid transporter protein-domain-containing protein [Lentinula aciculospora]
MSSWRSGNFAFGTPVSGSSVREVIASYRRAQYLAAGSTVASVSDESDEIDDEEAQLSSTFEEGEPDDLEEDEEDLQTPTVPSSQNDVFVDQFQWDDFDNTQTTAEVPSMSYTPRRPAERRPAAHEGTPLLKSKTSRLSTISGTHAVSTPIEGPSYGLHDPDGVPHTISGARRLSTTTKAESRHSIGGQSTFGQTLFNSIAILLGIGMLSEPLAFAYAGWIVGTILIILYGFISCYTAKLLARIILADPRLRSYADVGRKAFGAKSTVIISIMFCLELFAVSVILVTLYADSLHVIIPTYSSNTYKVWGLLLLIPMVFLPLSLLSYTSILGIISTITIIIVILYDGLSKPDAPGSLRTPAETSFTISNWANLGIAYGLFMAGFSGHAVIPSLARDMINPEEFDIMINWAFLVATSIYALIGYVGYLMFGSNVSDEISMDLLKTPGYNYIMNQAALWMLVISPLSKFALTTQPLNAVLEVLIGLEPAAASPEDMAIKMSTPVPWSFKTLLGRLQRVFVTIASVAVSITVPEFSALMAFLGSFSAFMICIIGPVAAKVAIERKCGILDGLILGTGIVMASWGTVAAFLIA